MYLGVALPNFIILFLVLKSSLARRMASIGFCYVCFVILYSFFELHTAYDIYSVLDNVGDECA